jgi:hypothetical protein
VDHRSDIFSVGAVFYEFLTYRHAFAGTNPIEILDRLRSEDPVPLPEVDPSLPPEICEIVARALRKNPAERYAELGHMRQELERARRRLTEEADRLRAQLLARVEEINRLRTVLRELIGQSLADESFTVGDERIALGALSGLEREAAAEADRLRRIAERAEAFRPALAEALAALDAGRVDEAVRSLEVIVAAIPDHLLAAQALDRAREAQLAVANERERVSALLRQADAALQQGQPGPGLEALRGVGALPAGAADLGSEVARMRAALERALAAERARQEAERALAAHTEARRQAQAAEAERYVRGQWGAAEAKAAESWAAWRRGAHAESTVLSAEAVELYGRAALSAGDVRRALERARAQADEAATHAAAARRRAELAQAARYAAAAWAAALDRHRQATAAHGHHEYAVAARLFTEAGHAYDGAASEAWEAAAAQARRVEALTLEAGTLLEAARWGEALARLDEALALAPEHAGAAELRGRVVAAQAVATQERARITALLSQVERALAQGQPARGLALLEQMGDFPEGAAELGAEVERLRAAAARAVAAERARQEAEAARQALEQARGRAEEAGAQVIEARSRAEGAQAARYAAPVWAAAAATQQQGMAAQEQRRYGAAARLFREAAAEYERAARAAADAAVGEARRVEALTREATTLVESGRPAEALARLEEALSLAPEHTEARNLRARVEAARAAAVREQERIAALLRDAEAALRQGEPWRGRQLLGDVGPLPAGALGAEVERVRSTIEQALATERARQEAEPAGAEARRQAAAGAAGKALERVRAQADEAAEQTSAARGRAERAHAGRHAPVAWAVAVEQQQQAIAAHARHEYEAAARLFTAAERDYDRAVQAALEAAAAVVEPAPARAHRQVPPAAIGIGAAAVLVIVITVSWRAFWTAPSPVPAPPVTIAPTEKRPTAPASGQLEAVEALRREVTAARQAAAVAGAERRAAATFEAANARERAADAAFKQRDWTAARSAYGEARSTYDAAAAEAATLARQEEDAQRAREQMSAARRAADVGGAGRLAEVPWAKATDAQKTAEAALKRGEFSKAAALFAESAESYREAEKVASETKAADAERARVAVVRQRLRAAEQAAADAADARRGAEQAAASRYASKAFAVAQQKEDAGRKNLDRQEYEGAESRLREAARDYQAALQEAQKAAAAERQAIAARQRQEAERAAEAERQAIAARQRQEAEKAAEAERQAIAARQRQEAEKAAEAERQAIAARQRQEAERAAEAERQAIATRQRQDAEQVRARALASREQAVKAGADVLVKDVFGSATARQSEGDGLAGKQDMLAARQAYQDAAERYGEAARRAQILQEAKAVADKARARMAAEKERARPETPEWNAAVAHERQGAQHYQRSGFREAGESFVAATESFAKAAARPPERPPERRPTPADEVRGVLDEYVQAFQTKDISLMQKVRPGLKPEDVRKLRDAFEQSRDYRVSLKVDSLNVTGDTAVVQGRREDNLVSKGGQAFRHESSFTFRLKRTSAGWVIDAVN